jgi:murein DD-endopeptidase MepM/ murein hydrolase activator NlpD
MSKKEKSVSTIIVTGLHQQQTKSFQIQTKHLKRLKYYISFIVISFALLLAHSYILSAESRREKTTNLHLKEEVKKLKVQIPLPKDTTKKDSNNIDLYIEGIQNKLQKINSYLKKRGVKSFNSALGGDSQESSLTDKEKIKLYNKYLFSLMKEIEAIPIGYPYYSSQASGYGYRSNPFTSEGSEFHAGLDFRGKTGDIVKSTAKGIVVGAGWYRGYGNCVRILHANKYLTLYGHLSKIKVKVGERITAGDQIGNIGSTGRSTGPHLHYEVRLNDKPLNPNLFLRI